MSDGDVIIHILRITPYFSSAEYTSYNDCKIIISCFSFVTWIKL